MDVLFISKKYYSYENRNSNTAVPHGLHKSAWFIRRYLKQRRFDADDVKVNDANDIDKIVTEKNPKIVVIEALWVSPEKMSEILSQPQHKNRLWLVRVHSKLSFLSGEGQAFDWLKRYKFDNLVVCANTRESARELKEILDIETMYLPNIYNPPEYSSVSRKDYGDNILKVGCFGSVRPLKNHIVQAVAAMKFADRVGQPLEFHINGEDVEKIGSSILQNLEELFNKHPKCKLVKHTWLEHKDFIDLIRQMDLGTQVSLSESFNIIAADFISQRVPIVVSDEISWVPKEMQVKTNASSDEIARHMYYVYRYYFTSFFLKCERALDFYNAQAKEVWMDLCNRIK